MITPRTPSRLALAAAALALTSCAEADDASRPQSAASAPAATPAAASPSAASPRAPAPPSEPFFADLQGARVRASQHLGEVVVLHFWATWCGPCRPEMPTFVKLHEEVRGRGARVVAASANARDEAPVVRRFMQETGMTFDTWLWVSAGDMRYYGVGPGLPATVVLDRSGRVTARFQGVAKADELRRAVEDALALPR